MKRTIPKSREKHSISMAGPKKNELIKQIRKQISLRDRVSQRREDHSGVKSSFFLTHCCAHRDDSGSLCNYGLEILGRSKCAGSESKTNKTTNFGVKSSTVHKKQEEDRQSSHWVRDTCDKSAHPKSSKEAPMTKISTMITKTGQDAEDVSDKSFFIHI